MGIVKREHIENTYRKPRSDRGGTASKAVGFLEKVG